MGRRLRSFRCALSTSAVAVILSSGAVRAQTPTAPSSPPSADSPASAETSGGLEDIIVTAQRRAERLQDVPLAVTALTAETLSKGGVSGSADLNLVIPGLNITNAAGYSIPRIRGVGSSVSTGGQENAVATYIDGVYIASSTSSALSFNNIAGVAVLKGPQGTLFGRNATGGVIQITTLDPQFDFSAMGSVTAGNRSTIGANAYITGGLTPGVAADLAVYFNDQRRGFGTNLFTGEDINKSRDIALRSKIKVTLGELTTIRIGLDYGDHRASIPVYRPVYGSIPFTGIPYTGGKFDINSDVSPLFHNEQGGGSITINQDLGGPSLVSITAYRKSKSTIRIDSDRTPVFNALTEPGFSDRQVSQEIQLLSASSSVFNWVLGAYYFNSHTAPVTYLKNPRTTTSLFTNNNAESYAGFGQATYQVAPKLNLTAGLRFTYEKRTFNGFGTVTNPAGTVVIAPLPFVKGEQASRKLTWRFAIDYHFSRDVLGYASYNRGFKSGGFNPTRISLPLNPYRGEQLDAYEVGLKGDFLDRRLRLNTAAFYYNYADIQAAAFNGGILSIFNATSAKIYGLDFDATAAVTPELTLTAGLSLVHDRLGDFPGATYTFPLTPNGTTVLGGNLVGTGNAVGNRLPTTPDWTLNLGAQYSVPLPNGRLDLSANYYHNDGWFGEVDNRLRQKAYDVVNASIDYLMGKDGNYRIGIWGKNLGNQAYATTLFAGAQGDGIGVAPGRTFGITVGAKY